jgi:predicted nucleotidyltransferase
VLLRLPAALHRNLARAAAGDGMSFNEYCVRRLSAPATAEDTSALRTLVVDRARAAFGDRLAGVLLVGSWARGDAGASSDIDVLFAVDPDVPLTRELYRDWDRDPVIWDGRVVDAHVTHLAPADAPPTAVWCEAALDGVVWFERKGAVSRRLGAIRRAIAEGQVVCGVAHGQPYWKGAA